MGTKKCPKGTIAFSISWACGVRRSNSPAAKAPMIEAEPAVAPQARPKASSRARSSTCPARPDRQPARTSGGTTKLPTTQRGDEEAERQGGDDGNLADGRLLSGGQAADHRQDDQAQDVVDHRGPSTIWLSGSCRRPRSLSTRAVMPTLVAVRAAPATIDLDLRQAEKWQTRYPPANGSTTPAMATAVDDAPARSNWTQVGFQPDLEQEDHHADFLQEMQDGGLWVRGDRRDRSDPGPSP